MYCTLQGWSINTIRFVEVHAVLVARASVKRARRANVESCYARTNQAVTMPPPILLILLLRAGRDSVQGLQGQVHCSRPLGGPSGAPARRWRDALRQQRRHWRGIGIRADLVDRHRISNVPDCGCQYVVRVFILFAVNILT